MKSWMITTAFLYFILVSDAAFADRYGICEPPECNGGGGLLETLAGIVLIGALVKIMSGIQKTVFVVTWVGVAALSFALGYKGFAVFWFTIGFWISLLLTSWLSEMMEFQNIKKDKDHPK